MLRGAGVETYISDKKKDRLKQVETFKYLYRLNDQ